MYHPTGVWLVHIQIGGTKFRRHVVHSHLEVSAMGLVIGQWVDHGLTLTDRLAGIG